MRWLPLVVVALTLTGCESGMHEMYDQPKNKPHTANALFANGNASRPQVLGTLPRSAGAWAGTSSGRRGHVAWVAEAGPVSGVDSGGQPLAQAGAATVGGFRNPLPLTPQLLKRGREHYNVYCAPCHSRVGNGDGMIVQRGFPAPPSYHTPRLRRAPDSHFYKVISDGYGVMFPYADRVAPRDRWAIVAYIRALQLSQHAPRAALSARDLAALKAATP